MKKIILLIFFFVSIIATPAQAYQLRQKTDFGSSLSRYKINQGNQEVAEIYFLIPGSHFHFFSVEDDPRLFNNLNSGVKKIAHKEKIEVRYALLADFSRPIEFERRFSFSYFFNSLGLMTIAPSYLKKVDILNPEEKVQRFFIHTYINGQELYSVMLFRRNENISQAKKILESIGIKKYKIYPLLNFPIALATFEDGKEKFIYQSDKNIEKYSCLYLATK